MFIDSPKSSNGFIYPLSKVVVCPPRDFTSVQLSGKEFRCVRSGKSLPILEKYVQCGQLLTDGFTRSACGWQVIDCKLELKRKFPDNKLYNECDILDDIPYHKYLNEYAINWLGYEGYKNVSETKTIETMRDKTDETTSNATQVFEFLGLIDQSNEADSESDPRIDKASNPFAYNAESESDETPSGTRKKNSSQYIRSTMSKHNCDPNLWIVNAHSKSWLNEFNCYISNWNEKDVTTVYGLLKQLVEYFQTDITVTDFDTAYFECTGSYKSNLHLYPERWQDKQIKYTNFSKIETNKASSLTTLSNDNEFTQVFYNIKCKIWYILLTYLAKRALNTNKKQTKRDIYCNYVYDLTNIYNELKLVDSKKEGIVSGFLIKNPLIAYIMQIIKWLIMMNQQYVTLFEHKSFATKIETRWNLMTLPSKYEILSFVQTVPKECDNSYVKYLRNEGLPYIFDNIFDKEIGQWQRMIGKGYTFKELWYLKSNWKSPLSRINSNTNKNASTNTQTQSQGTKTKLGVDSQLQEPAQKRRRLEIKNRAEFKQTLTLLFNETIDAQLTENANKKDEAVLEPDAMFKQLNKKFDEMVETQFIGMLKWEELEADTTMKTPSNEKDEQKE